MASDVIMPRLSDSMEEGTVLKWLVEEGGEVKRGEPLVEIETDKANMTYEADADGTLIEVVASEGDTLPIGEVIARVGDPDDASQDGGGAAQAQGGGEEGGAESGAGEDGREPGEEETERDESAVATAAEGDSEGATASGDGGAPAREGTGSAPAPVRDGDGRIKASPVARRIAGERGVDLSALEGSGPGGRIVKADVLAAAEGDGAAPAEGEQAPAEQAAPEPGQAVASGQAGPKGEVHVQELTRLQQTVSRRMAESKATAPDFTLEVEVEMGGCVELRQRLKEVADPVPSINDMIVKACALALGEYPRVNGAYRDGRFELYEKINIGIAVAAQGTLVVPTIFDMASKSLGEIARAAHEAIAKVRDNTITPPELSGGTFTVSNLGMFGIDRFSAVINPPQAAILTVGALKQKPIVDDSGRVVARDMAALSLVSDHRILYGADAAGFLARVREVLENPLALAL
jgi:pyruvate dehydrogenase E2 component (dihydrolipoyllysine-residue acetyltransferase)